MKLLNPDIKTTIEKIAECTLQNPKYVEAMKFYSIREVMYWGYMINRLKIEDEKKEVKLEIWNEIKKLELGQEASIRAAKGLYYLYKYAEERY